MNLYIVLTMKKIQSKTHKDELIRKMKFFLDGSKSTEEVCEQFKIPVRDKDKWDAEDVRNILRNSDYENKIVLEHYRPFDIHPLLYDADIIARPNVKVLQHMTNRDTGASGHSAFCGRSVLCMDVLHNIDISVSLSAHDREKQR